MSKPAVRVVFAVLTVAYVLSHFAGHAHAQSSLGIGANEAYAPSTGVFAHWLNWINAEQQRFYRALTGALKAMRDDGGKLWLMVGLSFAYGVFHAAGPGHGKAVISSYMLANEVALRRGVMLSFVSAFLQAATAVIVILLAFLVLRGTSISMTRATWFLEIASYALITCFGAWLLWTKTAPRLSGWFAGRPAMAFAGGPGGNTLFDDADRCRSDESAFTHYASGRHSSFAAMEVAAGQTRGDVCATCGNAHMADPARLDAARFDWRTAWSAVIAVGLRPCSGALIVLTFAFLNGLWLGGIVSVLAMALGTALTVSALATLAVTAKGWAVALAGGGRLGGFIHAGIEIGGAAFVFLVGLALLTASLNA